MRIGIDTRKLHDFGIGTYIRNLLRQLARLDHDTEFVLLCWPQDRVTLARLGENFRPLAETAPNYSIAEQFSVTLAELRQWNNLRSDRITRGVTLRVYPGGRPPATERASAKRPSKAAPSSEVAQQAAALPASPAMGRFHRVRAGETLWSIARAYQTTVEALRSANQFLISRQLQVGDQLLIASAPR